jgi:hypothetical protein
MKSLYVFVDESGNFDFSKKGTKVFALTFLSTLNPNLISGNLSNLKYSLLCNYSCGPQMEESGYFHATEDLQEVRNKVFDCLVNIDEIRIDTVIAQKNKAHPKFYKKDGDFYKLLAETGLKYILNRAYWDNCDHIIFIFSSLFEKRKRGVIKQTFKAFIKANARISFSLYFHSNQCDLCNQAADYYGWAIYRKWEIDDQRSYNLIQKSIKSEFNIFEKGTFFYY